MGSCHFPCKAVRDASVHDLALSAGQNASLFVSGIGYYTVFVNGVKVGDRELEPGWTDYSKRVLYSSYDITGHLQSKNGAAPYGGQLVIAVMLGNGWWSCGNAAHPTGQPHCDTTHPPQLLLQVQVNGKIVAQSKASQRH